MTLGYDLTRGPFPTGPDFGMEISGICAAQPSITINGTQLSSIVDALLWGRLSELVPRSVPEVDPFPIGPTKMRVSLYKLSFAVLLTMIQQIEKALDYSPDVRQMVYLTTQEPLDLIEYANSLLEMLTTQNVYIFDAPVSMAVTSTYDNQLATTLPIYRIWWMVYCLRHKLIQDQLYPDAVISSLAPNMQAGVGYDPVATIRELEDHAIARMDPTIVSSDLRDGLFNSLVGLLQEIIHLNKPYGYTYPIASSFFITE